MNFKIYFFGEFLQRHSNSIEWQSLWPMRRILSKKIIHLLCKGRPIKWCRSWKMFVFFFLEIINIILLSSHWAERKCHRILKEFQCTLCCFLFLFKLIVIRQECDRDKNRIITSFSTLALVDRQKKKWEKNLLN